MQNLGENNGPFSWTFEGLWSGSIEGVSKSRRATIARHLRGHLRDTPPRSPVVVNRVEALIEALEEFEPDLPYWADCG